MEEFFSAYPYFVPALFVVFWFFLMAMIARVSGWSSLAEIYSAHETFEGATKRFSSISLERVKGMPTRYNGAVNLGADLRGIHLWMLFLFRPYHPALSIPWSEIAATPKRFLLVEGVEFSFSRAPGVRLAMPRKLADWAAANSAGGFRLD